MTCSSPTHDALLAFGRATYCAQCFHAGYEAALKANNLPSIEDEIKQLEKEMGIKQ